MKTQPIIAYVGDKIGDGMGVNRYGSTSRNHLTDWHGEIIGQCSLASSWRVNSYIGSYMHQVYATIKEREYTGRGFGRGMSVVLRPTASQKRIDAS